jgi:gluconolactonase
MKRATVLAFGLTLLQIPAALSQQQPPLRTVTVTEIPGVVSAGATWTLAWAGTDNADGIVGTPDGGLLFAQEQPNRISKLDKNGKVSVFVEHTHGAGSVSMDTKGRLLAAERTCTDPGRTQGPPCAEPTRISVIYPEKESRVLADSVDGKSFGRPNDLVATRRAARTSPPVARSTSTLPGRRCRLARTCAPTGSC